jgi:hypothetical protein
MPTDEQQAIADFEAALLEVLSQDLPLAELQRRLAEDAAFAGFRDYVGSFEPRMLETASLLVKKWGRRNERDAGRVITE